MRACRIVALAALLVLPSCTSSKTPARSTGPSGPSTAKGTSMTSGLTYPQAAAKIHHYARESLSALPSGAALHALGPDNAVPCSDSDGAPPSTPVTVQADYWVDGLDRSGNLGHLDKVVAYWQSKGWHVTSDKRPGDAYVVLASAGFQVVVQLTGDGSRLGLSTTSPCVPPRSGSAPS